jgi:hypothetical protein
MIRVERPDFQERQSPWRADGHPRRRTDVSFYDLEGNRVSMLKALPRMDVRPKSQ